MIQQKLYTGLSGIQLPVPKYLFPPEYQQTSRLTYYASFFNSIEVNSSFYKIPRKLTLQRWATSVPKNFTFTFKLFSEVTHTKSPTFDPGCVAQFIDAISSVSEKRGCLLIQFPPRAGSERLEQLDAILAEILQNDPECQWRIAVEFRNRSWYNDETYNLLERYRAVAVLHDMKQSATPLNIGSPDFIYLRFHGPTGNYRGSYTHAFLAEYAEYISEWLSQGKTVYTYFNNTAGEAFHNLRTLQSMLL